MRRRIAVILFLAAALAGCAGEEAATYELRGTFTEEADQQQRDELREEIEDRGGQMAELESFPVQFHATGLAADDCSDVRSFAQDAAYVREVGECEREDETGDGGEPTGNDS